MKKSLIAILTTLVALDFVLNIYSYLKQKKIMDEIKNLQDAVEKNDTVDQSAITLLTGLKASLDEAIASKDLSKVQELSERIGASTNQLAAAVAANTPAAPAQ